MLSVQGVLSAFCQSRYFSLSIVHQLDRISRKMSRLIVGQVGPRTFFGNAANFLFLRDLSNPSVMASVAISVDPAFGWVGEARLQLSESVCFTLFICHASSPSPAVIVAAVIAAQVAVTGGRYVGAARRKVFNAEFFRKAKEVGLLEEHKKATGSDKLPNGAYPDMGSGRYGEWQASVVVYNPRRLGPLSCSCAASVRGLAALQQRSAGALQLCRGCGYGPDGPASEWPDLPEILCGLRRGVCHRP